MTIGNQSLGISKQMAETRLEQLRIEDLPIIQIDAIVRTVPSDWFARWRKLRTDFMKSLTDSVQELSFLNLSRDAFMDLIMGRKLPENMSVRLRVPLIYGGKLEIENMFLCHTFPVSQNIDRFIIEQYGNSKIWLPNPAKKIYLSVNMINGGGGGNATSDRLTQMAAQFAKEQGRL